MGLLSLFKRNESPPAEPAATPDAVVQARRLARRRLIGATVLLAVGVIGFPLVFETQPRPVRMDIPIEIPRKEGVPPLALPPASAPPAATINPPAEAPAEPEAPAATPSAPRAVAVSPPPVATERAGEQGREVPPPAAKASAKPAATAASRPPAPAAAASAPRRSNDGARALAILEGQAVGAPASAPASSSAAVRIVIQVGAYTDADKLREVRAKVEKLGYKTYTQVVATDGQSRTRVRIGPFAAKADADKVAARIKSAGLPAAMLTL